MSRIKQGFNTRRVSGKTMAATAKAYQVAAPALPDMVLTYSSGFILIDKV
jgi:hypothetical protein